MRKEVEGGCGVIGLSSSRPVAGKHLLVALEQMCNRGNGKGGGIAAVGLAPKAFQTTSKILEEDYLLAIAYLDTQSIPAVENEFVYPIFDVDHRYEMPQTDIQGLDVPPPKVIVYFVKVKSSTSDELADEIVYQNSYQLNKKFYASSGEKIAFVLSHGKNLIVLKMVGYGDQVIRAYQLEEFTAHVWIGHHRYPTKGKVWHPGGAHPFIGLNEALVHNGDFANYYSICEYLAQKNIHPLFMTDTEVSVLTFDLLHRLYKYPLEYVIEALAPTTERDFTLLPEDKQKVYKALQDIHIHGSPDGPWFFLIAQSIPQKGYRLIGITDTSMLRPQVFAIQKGDASIGFAASEKQAIDAVLESLSKEGPYWTRGDFYWNARGGSHTDGGAFLFTIDAETKKLTTQNKFGQEVHPEKLRKPLELSNGLSLPFPNVSAKELHSWALQNVLTKDSSTIISFLNALTQDNNITRTFDLLTMFLDFVHPLPLRRSSFLSLVDIYLNKTAEKIKKKSTLAYTYIEEMDTIYPASEEQTIIINATLFPSEGINSLARAIVDLRAKGFKKFMVMNCHGQRFIGNGLGPGSHGVRIDVYGSSGDYLGSGIDGAEIYVHGTAQDQLGQIMKSGKLVVYGDVGQTLLYGSKGGEIFIRGNAAGRPCINAVGKVRVVINGTALDYLGEAFMAGNPLKEGGFVIINAIGFDYEGNMYNLPEPYPGSNLFSLASGGAIYIRDPRQWVSKEQLNGGEFMPMTHEDEALIHPFLEENSRLFDISLKQLLTFEGNILPIQAAYRKIAPIKGRVLEEEEAWVKGKV